MIVLLILNGSNYSPKSSFYKPNHANVLQVKFDESVRMNMHLIALMSLEQIRIYISQLILERFGRTW